MSFFSHQEAGRGRASREAEGEERQDEQQVLLLNALRRAAGAPVSYAELRDVGIEFPAGVVSELELEGVPLQRCRAGGGPGVRLEPAPDLTTGDPPEGDPPEGDPPEGDPPEGDPPEGDQRRSDPPTGGPPAGDPTSEWTDVRIYRASRGGAFMLATLGSLPRKARGAARTRRPTVSRSRTPRPTRRLLALLLLVAAIGIVVALVLVERAAGSQPTSAKAAHRPRAEATSFPTSTRSRVAVRRARAASRTPPTPVSPLLASELAVRGHDDAHAP